MYNQAEHPKILYSATECINVFCMDPRISSDSVIISPYSIYYQFL